MESYVLFTDEDLKNDQFQNRSNKQKISNDNTSVVKSNQSENLVTDDCFSDFESLKSMNIKVLSDNERKLFELLTEKMDIRIIQNDYPSVYEMLCEKIPVITSLSYKNEYMYAYICYLISYGLFYDIMKYKITSVDRFVSYFVYKKNIDNHFAAFVFEHMRYMSSVKNNYPSIYNYVMRKCPIPKDFDSTIKVHKAMYVYMLLHNMTEFPKSQISGRYVNFDKKRNRFSIFADEAEKYSEEGNRLWHEHYV